MVELPTGGSSYPLTPSPILSNHRHSEVGSIRSYVGQNVEQPLEVIVRMYTKFGR